MKSKQDYAPQFIRRKKKNQQNYLTREKEQGFYKRSVMVHKDDWQQVKGLADRLRKERKLFNLMRGDL